MTVPGYTTSCVLQRLQEQRYLCMLCVNALKVSKVNMVLNVRRLKPYGLLGTG